MLAISTMKTPQDPPKPIPTPDIASDTDRAPSSPSLPRASMPKMTLDSDPVEDHCSPKKEVKSFFSYELKHELPMKCAGIIIFLSFFTCCSHSLSTTGETHDYLK